MFLRNDLCGRHSESACYLADGTRRVPDGFADGTRRVIDGFADGTRSVIDAFADGTRSVSDAFADGTRSVPATFADGTRGVPATLVPQREQPFDRCQQTRLVAIHRRFPQRCQRRMKQFVDDSIERLFDLPTRFVRNVHLA